MVYALVWFIVVSLLGLWSLAAWALHAVGIWTVSTAGTVGGAASSPGLHSAEWISRWLPAELAEALTALFARLEPAVQAVLQAAPALTEGLSAVVWGAWAIGSVLLVVAGGAVHALIAIVRRRGERGALPPTPLVDAR